MSKKQTAVEWLSQNIPDLGKYIPFGVSMELHAKFQQAKKMEKQQMKDATLDNVTTNKGLRKIFEKQFEEYYKKTYGDKEI